MLDICLNQKFKHINNEHNNSIILTRVHSIIFLLHVRLRIYRSTTHPIEAFNIYQMSLATFKTSKMKRILICKIIRKKPSPGPFVTDI